MALSYKKVFDRYNKTTKEKCTIIGFELYKRARVALSRIKPITKEEKFILYPELFKNMDSSDMPKGFDYDQNEECKGTIELDYIDFYDYLPREDLDYFKKSLRKAIKDNDLYKYGRPLKDKDIDDLGLFEHYQEYRAIEKVVQLQISNETCNVLEISIYNLSMTFIAVRYRISVSNTVNKQLSSLYLKTYSEKTEFFGNINFNWYRRKGYGTSFISGDSLREQDVYEYLTTLKWNILKFLRKYFKIYFFENDMFPPTFLTYTTNIRPPIKLCTATDNAHYAFWKSILFDCYHADYSIKLNTSVDLSYKNSKYEGTCLSAFYGGNIDKKNREYVHDYSYNISKIYALYLVASSIVDNAERNIAIYNKKISNAIIKSKIIKLLKMRTDIEKKFYYANRFLNEFNTYNFDYDEEYGFKSLHPKKHKSITLRLFENFDKQRENTKNSITGILDELNKMTEFKNSEYNTKIQLCMILITILSLIVAIISLKNPTNQNNCYNNESTSIEEHSQSES